MYYYNLTQSTNNCFFIPKYPCTKDYLAITFFWIQLSKFLALPVFLCLIDTAEHISNYCNNLHIMVKCHLDSKLELVDKMEKTINERYNFLEPFPWIRTRTQWKQILYFAHISGCLSHQGFYSTHTQTVKSQLQRGIYSKIQNSVNCSHWAEYQPSFPSDIFYCHHIFVI